MSLFCNVPLDAVIEARDVDHTIYELPLKLQEEKLDEIICQLLGITRAAGGHVGLETVRKPGHRPKKRVKIAVVGKYIDLQDAYKSIYEALTHAAAAHDCGIDLVRVDAQEIETNGPSQFLRDVAGIVVPGGFGIGASRGRSARPNMLVSRRCPLSGALPRDAGGDDRVCPQCLRPRRCEQHGI